MNLDDLPPTTSRRGLVVGLVLGLPVLAYGIRGVLVDAARTHPAELTRWIVGSAVVNDALVLPAALVAGWAARRFVPRWAWPAVRTGLLTSAVLVLIAWPFVRGYGRRAANPSLLPRDYGGGLLAALAVVWLAVVAWAALTRWRGRQGARAGDAPAQDPPAGDAPSDDPPADDPAPQDTPSRSTTNTSVSSGPMTPPAPLDP